MRLFRIFIIVLLFAAAGVGFYLYEDTKLPPQAQPLRPAATTTGSVTTPPPEPEVTLEEMVGELFMVGHWAETPVASTSELIDTYHLGSVVIMSVPEDPTEIRSWVRTWNASSTRPLFIAIDQEGGSVSRLKGPTFIQTSQREIISTSSAYQVGLVRGKELEKLGINLNLAPVLDYASTTDSFMYQRSFASRELTADMAGAMIAGMSESGVIGVAKHFPGHADTTEDSHVVLPSVPITLEALPAFTSSFEKLIAEYEVAAVMTAHVQFPQIDTQPATLSYFFLTNYLRDGLGFDGVIITDDLIMQAVSSSTPAGQAAVPALQAGADVLMFAAEPARVGEGVTAVLAAVAQGRLSEARIKESYERIQNAKGLVE